MRRAAKIDENQPEIVKALRAVGCEVLSLAAVGNGCPDLLVWSPRAGLLLIEIKDGEKPPSARKLTPDQVEFHRKWPGTIHVAISPAQALEACGYHIESKDQPCNAP